MIQNEIRDEKNNLTDAASEFNFKVEAALTEIFKEYSERLSPDSMAYLTVNTSQLIALRIILDIE